MSDKMNMRRTSYAGEASSRSCLPSGEWLSFIIITLSHRVEHAITFHCSFRIDVPLSVFPIIHAARSLFLFPFYFWDYYKCDYYRSPVCGTVWRFKFVSFVRTVA